MDELKAILEKLKRNREELERIEADLRSFAEKIKPQPPPLK